MPKYGVLNILTYTNILPLALQMNSDIISTQTNNNVYLGQQLYVRW